MIEITGVPQDVADRLTALHEDHGRLVNEVLVEDGRDEGSPLHRYFTWDEGEAAAKCRLAEAGELIRRVHIRVTTYPTNERKVEVNVRKFVATEELDGTRGYRDVQEMASGDDQMLILNSIKRDIERLRRKYSGYEELFSTLLNGDAAA